MESGSHLFSRAVTSQVSSAVCVLTVVFGMGTGVSHRRITTGNLRLCLQNRIETSNHIYFPASSFLDLGQALDRLVPVSYTHCYASTSGLSTLSSSRGLTSEEWDILS